VAIAGIMGGEDSEVRPETTDLLLEAANFDPLTVLRTSRRLRLRTESSTRWEKGVDPYAAEQAAVYATQLLAELAGARWTGHVDAHDGLPERPRVTLLPELAERLSGMQILAEEQTERLRSIGFEVGDDLEVTVPTWRARDVTRSVDLVEEVVRFRMEDVPETLPSRPASPSQLTRNQRLRRQVEDVLVGAGFHEAYTWTLVPPGEGRVPLQEPFTAELAVLRDSLDYWLLESARRNRNAGVERIALFELARVFSPGDGDLPEERWHVAGVTDGGYFRAKGAVETLHRALDVEPDFLELDVRALEEGWGYFEVDLDTLFERMPDVVLYKDVITYPDVKQDLAFVVDEEVSAGDLVAGAKRAAGPELREFRPFDVYRGEQVGPGKKSIAFSASFQSPERTLTDEDAAGLRGLIAEALAHRFGAQLRT
jgi:phenylalanyl-tRNA synthetase beta chain